MAPKFMKSIDKVAQGITTNKYVLYVVLCLAIVNVVTFLATDNFISLAIFALVGFLATRFTKNMIIVLLSTLIISTILHVSRKTVEGFQEGAGGEDEDEKEKEDKEEKEEELTDDEEEEEGTSVAGTDDDTERKEGMKGMKGKKKQNKQSSGVPREPSGVPPRESSGVPRKPPSPTADGFNTQDAAPYVNEKKTKAAAFNNITKGLGGANINQMNADTQDLLKHQDSLTAAMKGMQPMIQQAGDMLKQLDSTGLTDILGNLGGMNFGGKKKNN
jgi:hypothetical protein